MHIYANAEAKVRCGGGVGWVMCGRWCARDGAWVWLRAGDGALQGRRRVVDGGRYVRRRVSEIIGTYQNLSEEIGWVRISSDWL